MIAKIVRMTLRRSQILAARNAIWGHNDAWYSLMFLLAAQAVQFRRWCLIRQQRKLQWVGRKVKYNWHISRFRGDSLQRLLNYKGLRLVLWLWTPLNLKFWENVETQPTTLTFSYLESRLSGGLHFMQIEQKTFRFFKKPRVYHHWGEATIGAKYIDTGKILPWLTCGSTSFFVGGTNIANLCSTAICQTSLEHWHGWTSTHSTRGQTIPCRIEHIGCKESPSNEEVGTILVLLASAGTKSFKNNFPVSPGRQHGSPLVGLTSP